MFFKNVFIQRKVGTILRAICKILRNIIFCTISIVLKCQSIFEENCFLRKEENLAFLQKIAHNFTYLIHAECPLNVETRINLLPVENKYTM